MSIESTPIACWRRRWFSERLRAIRYSHGRTLIGALVGEDRVERRGEDLLQHVLGVLARGEHVAAEREQARLVPADQRLERGMVARADEGDEPLVRLEAEQWGGTAKTRGPGMCQGRCFHARA